MAKPVIVGWGDDLSDPLPVGVARGSDEALDTKAANDALFDAELRFTLEELFQGKSAGEWRLEYAGVFDWGPDVGCEAIRD